LSEVNDETCDFGLSWQGTIPNGSDHEGREEPHFAVMAVPVTAIHAVALTHILNA
jgi:hypothetical protein